jgi:hypothetical protein
MTSDEARQVVTRLVGYWPSPALDDAQAVAWVDELTNPVLRITPAEAITVLRRASHSGQTYRPTCGQVVAGVQAERRAQARITDTSKMLAERRAGAVSPERAGQWLAACRRVLAGEPLESAKAAEGIES